MAKGRKGLTGLETAIILIAFIITAAAFAFAILNVGFQTTQQAQSVITTGAREAASALELAGAVVAEGDKGSVTAIRFTIKLSPGLREIDLSAGKLAVAFITNKVYYPNVYEKNGTIVTIVCLQGDRDHLLEIGEKYEVIINVTSLEGVELGPNDEFIIELKPQIGATLTIHRVLPAEIRPVNFLGAISRIEVG